MLSEPVHKYMERSELSLDGTCPQVTDHGVKVVSQCPQRCCRQICQRNSGLTFVQFENLRLPKSISGGKEWRVRRLTACIHRDPSANDEHCLLCAPQTGL